MKSMWLMVLAAAAAWGQSVYTGGSTSSGGAWGGASTICGPPLYLCPSANAPALPQVFVNDGEGDAAFSFELTLPGTWVTGPPSGVHIQQ